MTDAARAKQERELAAVILLLFGQQYDDLVGGVEFSTRDFVNRVAPALVQPLARTYTASANRLLGRFDVVTDIEPRATRWAERYSRQLARELAGTTRDRLAELDPRDPDFEEDLAATLADDRAENIGITETTRAISAGENEAARRIEKETGRILRPRWMTEEDEDVCPICEPLNHTTSRVWGRRFPGGPPAHPRCRCELSWT